MERKATALLTAIATLALVGLVALGVVFTGAYDVAATESHWPITRWALNTLQHNSVSARADDVAGSPPTDADAIAHGFEHFDAMCVTCHGAPGVDRGELGRGITPTPPELSEEVGEWSDAELFWITKHGIRLAGMPAFGPTHSDEEIWSIVAFLDRLEGMTPAEYASLRAEHAAADGEAGGDGEGGHSHAPGTPEHGHQGL